MNNKEKSNFSENFDGLNILCIPEQELPAKPNHARIEPLRDFLQKSEIKNKELFNIMKETALKNEQKPIILESEETKKAEIMLKKNGLSEQLLMKVHIINQFIIININFFHRLKQKKEVFPKPNYK